MLLTTPYVSLTTHHSLLTTHYSLHLLALLAAYECVAVLDTRDLRSPAFADLGGKAWRWRDVRALLQRWRALLLCKGTFSNGAGGTLTDSSRCRGTLADLMCGWPADRALLTSRQELRVLLMHYLDTESLRTRYCCAPR